MCVCTLIAKYRSHYILTLRELLVSTWKIIEYLDDKAGIEHLVYRTNVFLIYT